MVPPNWLCWYTLVHNWYLLPGFEVDGLLTNLLEGPTLRNPIETKNMKFSPRITCNIAVQIRNLKYVWLGYIWWFPEIGIALNHPNFNGSFPNINHPAMGVAPWPWKPPCLHLPGGRISKAPPPRTSSSHQRSPRKPAVKQSEQRMKHAWGYSEMVGFLVDNPDLLDGCWGKPYFLGHQHMSGG